MKQPKLSLRDSIALKALDTYLEKYPSVSASILVDNAYNLADAVMKRRKVKN